jgi:serine protease inhibitor
LERSDRKTNLSKRFVKVPLRLAGPGAEFAMPIPRRELLKRMGGGLLALGSWEESLLRANEAVMDDRAINVPFAEAFLRIALARPENTVVSPESIVGALRLLLAGARGETAANLRHVLGASALLEGAPVTETAKQGEEEPGSPKVRLANGVWIQRGIAIAEAFRRTALERFRSEVGELDFARSPREAGRLINEWVSRATQKHITALCSAGGPDPSTQLLLTSAIFFQGAWMCPFIERKTKEHEFRTPRRKVSVPFMRAFDSFQYAEDSETTFLQLPYTGSRYAMVLALPGVDRPPVGALEGLMAVIHRLPNAPCFEQQLVEVSLPRFSLRWRADLAGTLRQLGLNDVFDPALANFQGLTAQPVHVAVSNVIHEAYMRVDEKGTDAAAFTGIDFQVTSTPATTTPRRFAADHPFLFAITDTKLGRLLFAGQIVDPGY